MSKEKDFSILRPLFPHKLDPEVQDLSSNYRQWHAQYKQVTSEGSSQGLVWECVESADRKTFFCS